MSQTQFITINGRQGLSDAIAPTLINTHTALGIAPYWRSQNFLADNLASFGRSVHQDGAKLADRHPLDRILKRRPNQFQTAFQHWRTSFFHASHRGNSYSLIRRASTDISGLYNLNPDDVTPFRMVDDVGDWTAGSQWYWYAPSKRAIPAADVIHFYGLGYDGMIGYAPLDILCGVFSHAAAVEARMTKAMQRGTTIVGAVEIPEGAGEERQEQIVATLQKFRSPNSDRDMIVLSDGAKLSNQSISPQQMQLIEQGALTTKRIAQVTGVAPEYLFERSESKYNNSAVEQAGQDVVRFTFRPWIEMAEDELTAKLLSDVEQEQGYTIKLNPDALLRGDTATQMAVVTQGVGGGVMAKNEGRDQLGLPRDPNPESDQLLTPTAVASAPAQEAA